MARFGQSAALDWIASQANAIRKLLDKVGWTVADVDLRSNPSDVRLPGSAELYACTVDETAATDYFRQTSSANLTTAFTPIVHRSLEHVGVVKQYSQVIKAAPGGSALAGEFDLDKYVVDKTLDGLFYMLGIEESKIRKNPAAQTTDLLKEVFGRK